MRWKCISSILFSFYFEMCWTPQYFKHFMCTMASRCSCVFNLVCEMNMSHQAIHFKMQHQNNFRWAVFTRADFYLNISSEADCKMVEWLVWHRYQLAQLCFNIQFVMYWYIYMLLVYQGERTCKNKIIITQITHLLYCLQILK